MFNSLKLSVKLYTPCTQRQCKLTRNFAYTICLRVLFTSYKKRVLFIQLPLPDK